jgi:serine/threonine protein phosphatase PrpC
MACSAGSPEPVFAGRDGYCPSCGRPIAVDWAQAGPDRDHLEWSLGQAAGVSDRGLQCSRNDDAMDFAVVDTEDRPIAVAIVSDGISSAPRPHEASWRAALTGTKSLAEGIFHGDDPVEASHAAVQAAGQALTGLAGPEGSPAATYVSAVVSLWRLTVCWLGDSRAYWLTAESGYRRSWQVTRDDSMVVYGSAPWRTAAKEVTDGPQPRVITNWLGADLPEPQPHVAEFRPPGPGVLLLCSAGLWSHQPEPADLAAMVLPAALNRPLDAACDLVKSAIDAGGLDNITAVLIPFPPQVEPAP